MRCKTERKGEEAAVPRVDGKQVGHPPGLFRMTSGQQESCKDNLGNSPDQDNLGNSPDRSSVRSPFSVPYNGYL